MCPVTMHLQLRNEKEVCNNLLSRLKNDTSTDISYVPPALLNCHMHEVTKQGHRRDQRADREIEASHARSISIRRLVTERPSKVCTWQHNSSSLMLTEC